MVCATYSRKDISVHSLHKLDGICQKCRKDSEVIHSAFHIRGGQTRMIIDQVLSYMYISLQYISLFFQLNQGTFTNMTVLFKRWIDRYYGISHIHVCHTYPLSENKNSRWFMYTSHMEMSYFLAREMAISYTSCSKHLEHILNKQNLLFIVPRFEVHWTCYGNKY